MSQARDKHTRHERSIAKALGLTDAQLDALLRVKSGRWPGTAAAALERKGLAYREQAPRAHGGGLYYTGRRGLTDKGAALLARARRMGF